MNLTDRVIANFGPEDHEQYGFVQWLDIIATKHPIRFTAIPNSTFTKSPMVRIRNTLLGLRPGLCDMVIVYPNRWILFAEMKRLKGGQLSPAQKEWIDLLNTIPNVEAHRCNGAEAAKQLVTELIGEPVHNFGYSKLARDIDDDLDF